MNISRKQLTKAARYLLVELLIVFVGVYLAFQLHEYKAERETNQRRQQLREALAQEIDVFLLGADQLIPQLDAMYADWRQRYDAGEKPAPLHFAIGGANLPPRGMWQAVLASDGLATLPVDSMQKVSQFYNALDILLGKYSDMIEFAEQQIIPHDDTAAFYQADSGSMKREYAAYMGRMQDMLRLFKAVREMAVTSKASLADEVDQPAQVDEKE